MGAFGYALASVINVVTAPSALGWVSYEEFVRSYNPVPTFLQFTPVFLVALVLPGCPLPELVSLYHWRDRYS